MKFSIGGITPYDQLIASKAAAGVLDTTVADWRGKPASLRSITDELGTSENVFLGARQVALELIRAGKTLQEVTTMPRPMMPKPLQKALDHFYMLMHDDRDLASMGMGKGQMLLIQMDQTIADYLKNKRPEPSLRAS